MPDGKADYEAYVKVPKPLLRAARERIRHDHGYSMEVYDAGNPHRCDGCEVEDYLDACLEGRLL